MLLFQKNRVFFLRGGPGRAVAEELAEIPCVTLLSGWEPACQQQLTGDAALLDGSPSFGQGCWAPGPSK